MKITFVGHSCFYIEGSKTILIDPFLEGNPLTNKKPADFTPDYIPTILAMRYRLQEAAARRLSPR